jgi:hypothetical protein
MFARSIASLKHKRIGVPLFDPSLSNLLTRPLNRIQPYSKITPRTKRSGVILLLVLLYTLFIVSVSAVKNECSIDGSLQPSIDTGVGSKQKSKEAVRISSLDKPKGAAP